MDSKAETFSTKSKAKYTKNLESKECVRPFKLQQHYPSTLTELRKNEMDKGPCIMQAKGVTNIISALPFSDMTFIPNKEVQPSEVQNVQKLKFKSISGKDLAEVKVDTRDSKFQTKFLTVPKIIKKSNRFKKLAEPLAEEVQGQKPKIKNITQILTTSPTKEQYKKSEEAFFSKSTLQIINGKKKLTLNPTQNCSKQILIPSTAGDVLQKIVSPNAKYNTQQNPSQFVTLKRVAGFSNVLMVQQDNNQLITPAPEKFKQIALLRNSVLNKRATKKNDNTVIIQTQLSNSSLKKRDSSFLDQAKNSNNKRLCHGTKTEDFETNEDYSKIAFNKEFIESSETKNCSSQTVNTAASKKNIMVIVPNETAKELTMASNSSNTSNEDLILDDNSEITFLNDEDVTESNNFNEDVQKSSEKNIMNSFYQNEEQSGIIPLNINQTTHNESENLLDEFSILEKAVLSVQDDNLRAKALKALKDCGIKTKKKVFIKRPLPTKIINESAVQTSVFSLLKEGEFLEADEAHENLIKIKSNRKFPKQPISTLGTISNHEICPDQAEYEKKLDIMINKIFPDNKDVSDVKNAFVQNKKLQAKHMLEQLLKDFEAAKNYDKYGYLGIHKAVANNNLQDVQKHIIILKAAKQNIDICTEEGQTSLELAVELEVDPQITKILLDSGAQPVSSKAVHDSALILAAKKSSRVLPLLLKRINRNHQNLLNSKNSEGFAAIHYCAQFGNVEGITELIKHGADVNVQDERSGRTALFYAVDTKNSDIPQEVYNEIAQKLVDNGAFSNIPTFSKHSVLSLIDDVKSHTLKIALNRAVR